MLVLVFLASSFRFLPWVFIFLVQPFCLSFVFLFALTLLLFSSSCFPFFFPSSAFFSKHSPARSSLSCCFLSFLSLPFSLYLIFYCSFPFCLSLSCFLILVYVFIYSLFSVCLKFFVRLCLLSFFSLLLFIFVISFLISVRRVYIFPFSFCVFFL